MRVKLRHELIKPLMIALTGSAACFSLPVGGYAAPKAAPEIFEQNNDLFARKGPGSQPVELTRDHKKKDCWALSPDGITLAYSIQPGEKELRTIQFLNIETRQHKSYPAARKDEQVGTGSGAVKLEWIDAIRLGMEFHINPSCSQYTILDGKTGALSGQYLGYWFTWSPAKKHVAYVGWVPHFGPSEAHSHYLQIDGKTVYPTKNMKEPYKGDHEFLTPLVWSPSGNLIAVVDRTKGNDYLAISGLQSKNIVAKIPSKDETISNPPVWVEDQFVQLQEGDRKHQFEVGRKHWITWTGQDGKRGK
ncbi:MAG TPA: hypothetical protein V6C72_17645 [Chroococcales cyanobacterium]